MPALCPFISTSVSLCSGRLWPDEAHDALFIIPDEALWPITLIQRGLAQLAKAFINPADPKSTTRYFRSSVMHARQA